MYLEKNNLEKGKVNIDLKYSPFFILLNHTKWIKFVDVVKKFEITNYWIIYKNEKNIIIKFLKETVKIVQKYYHKFSVVILFNISIYNMYNQ